MRPETWVLLLTGIICLAFVAARGAEAYEAEIDITNADAPSVNAVRPLSVIDVSIFLHSNGSALRNMRTDLYLLSPTPGAVPGAMEIVTDDEGWSNTTLSVALRVAGEIRVSVCDRSRSFGLGGVDGFYLASDAIPVVGIATERSFYRPGEVVAFHVINDPDLTNVTEPGEVLLVPDNGTSSTVVGDGPSGSFALPQDTPPGLYWLLSEDGGLSGTFGVSDVALLPELEVYPLGGTVTIDTSMSGLTATIVRPDGEWLTYGISKATEVQLPDEGSGDHLVIVDRGGVILLKERVHVVPCDLWVAPEQEVYAPGSEVRVHFAARDIGVGLSGFSSFDYDLYYYDGDGEHKVSATLQQTSGVIVLDAPEAPLTAQSLRALGKCHRVEMRLNIGGETVLRAIPLTFGTGEIDLDPPVSHGRKDIVVDIATIIAGERPLWTIWTVDGPVTTAAPPVALGVDPMGRAMARFDRNVLAFDHIDAVEETVESPLPGVEVTCRLVSDQSVATLITDAIGKATYWSRGGDPGTDWVEATATVPFEMSSRVPVTVNAHELEFAVDGPDLVKAGESFSLDVAVLEDGVETSASVHFLLSVEGMILLSGKTNDGSISLVAPDIDGLAVLSLSTSVGGTPLAGEHVVIVVSSGLYVALAGGTVAPREYLRITYAFTGGELDELTYSSAFGSGALTGTAIQGTSGSILLRVPGPWDGTEEVIRFTARGDGRVAEAMLNVRREVAVDVTITERSGNLVFELDLDLPHGAEFTSANFTVLDPQGDAAIHLVLDEVDNGTQHFLLSPTAGLYTIEVSITYLTTGGLGTVLHSEAYSHVPIEGDRDDGLFVADLAGTFVLVLGIAMIAVIIIAVGAMRRSSDYRRRFEQESAKRAKLGARLKRLEALLPSEEGQVRIEPELSEIDEETGHDTPAPLESKPQSPVARKPSRSAPAESAEAPCPMCGEKMFIPGHRPVTVRCAGCSFEFIVE